MKPINIQSSQIVGLDVGGTSAKAVLLENGREIWRGQSEPYHRPDAGSLIGALRRMFADRAADATLAGICVPGILDEATRTITLAVNLPGVVGVPLDELVEHAIGHRAGAVQIINDACAAAIDAARALNLHGRVAAISLGTGVGMAVLDDGRPLLVEAQSPGHVGQIDVSLDDNAPIGPDGGRGSLEAYIGVPALTRDFGSAGAFLTAAAPNATPLQALARAIRIIHAIYRPDHVVLLGGIGIRLAPRLADLKQQIDHHLTSVARPDWQLHAGQHDYHAALGAATLAMQAIRG